MSHCCRGRRGREGGPGSSQVKSCQASKQASKQDPYGLPGGIQYSTVKVLSGVCMCVWVLQVSKSTLAAWCAWLGRSVGVWHRSKVGGN